MKPTWQCAFGACPQPAQWNGVHGRVCYFHQPWKLSLLKLDVKR